MPSPTLLIIDDDVVDRMAVRRLLLKIFPDAELHEASDAPEALREMSQRHFDCVLLDLQLPKADGTEIMARARALGLNLPMIALTGHGDEQTAVDIMKAGAVDYIAKSRLSERVLSTSIERALRLHRAEEAVRQQNEQTRRAEERFRSLVLATNQLVWSTDARGRALEDLPLWRAFTGQAPADLLGHGWLDAIHSEDRERAERIWQSSVARAEPYEEEFRLHHHSGAWRWILARGVPVLSDSGEVREWVGIAADITDRRQAEEERERLLASEQESRREAERSNRLKDEFLATVSHELRTPLQSILGWARLLSAEPGEAPEAHRIDRAHLDKGLSVIVRNAQAQLQLIDDILDVSRIITGKLRLSPDSVQVTDFIRTAVETVKAAADGKHIELTTHIAPGVETIFGDPDRLQQIVWNLLSNAVKFTPTGGKVAIDVSQADESVVIRVTDSGQGIRSDFLPYVFDRFRQANAASTRNHGGLGLGLAIVRHLVELHGGKVAVESAGEGRGATFSVSLPVHARMREEGGPEEEREWPEAEGLLGGEGLTLSGRRVLVVDDETDARELFATLIREYGAEVATAPSVKDALVALHSFRPDVLVSDIAMPNQDGYDLVRQLRALDADNELRTVPAIALTAYARQDDRRRALAAGFQLHVAKPVDPRELVHAISRLLATKTRGQ
jgi:PAS domain S-box-containing protein